MCGCWWVFVGAWVNVFMCEWVCFCVGVDGCLCVVGL